VSALGFLDIGFPELVVVGFVGLMLYGGRLPEMMRTFGQSYRKLRKSVEDLSRDVQNPAAPPNPPAPYRPSPPIAPQALPRTPPPAPAPPSPKTTIEDDAPPV